jgi:hypothetical protein
MVVSRTIRHADQIIECSDRKLSLEFVLQRWYSLAGHLESSKDERLFSPLPASRPHLVSVDDQKSIAQSHQICSVQLAQDLKHTRL